MFNTQTFFMCSHFPNTFSRGTVQKFRGTLVCRDTPFENPCNRQMSNLVTSHRKGQQESCSKDGLVGSPPEQVDWILRRNLSCYTSSSSSPWWTTRTLPGGPLPAFTPGECRCYNPIVFVLLGCPFVFQYEAYSRGSGCSIIFRPHQIPDCVLRPNVSLHGELPSSANRQIFTLTEDYPRCPTRKPSGACQQSSRGYRLTMAKSTKRIVLSTEKPRTFRIPWLRVLRDFSSVVTYIAGYKWWKDGLRPTPLPPQVWTPHISA
jgi:hypothetical protein